MKSKHGKINIFNVLLVLLIVILIVFFIFKLSNKNNSENKEPSTPTLSNNTQETFSNNIKEDIPEIQNINEKRKLCSELTTKRDLPVLMYHFFYDENAGETGKDANFMEIHDFEDQIKYLADNNYYVPTWEEVVNFVNGKIGLPEKSIILTVDDGDESFFRLAVPVLKKYNFYATSFLITSWYEGQLDNFISPEVDFQTHSHNMHKPGSDGKGTFLTLSQEDAKKDLLKTRSIIGENCVVFCYPFGHYNDKTKQTLKDCNYKLAFTTKYGRISPGTDCYELPRIRMSKGDSLDAFISKIK